MGELVEETPFADAQGILKGVVGMSGRWINGRKKQVSYDQFLGGYDVTIGFRGAEQLAHDHSGAPRHQECSILPGAGESEQITDLLNRVGKRPAPTVDNNQLGPVEVRFGANCAKGRNSPVRGF